MTLIRAAPAWISAVLAIACLAFATGASAQDTVHVRIIAFNDFHGHLEPGNNVIAVEKGDSGGALNLASGGAAYLATRIRQLRAEQQNSVVVSAGDLLGASPLVSGLFLDEPTIEAMNAMGLDVNAVGNHEFDRGYAELKRLMSGGCNATPPSGRISCASGTRFTGARFPFIAANVTRDGGDAAFQPVVIREFDGVKVAFVGAVTRTTPSIVRAGAVEGLTFGAEARAINEQADRLKSQGVRAVVAVIHEGGDADGGINGCESPRGSIFDIAAQLDPLVRVVISGHTHRAYRCVIDGRLVMQAASFGRLIAVVDIEIDRATGQIRGERTHARNVPVPNGLGRRDASADGFAPLSRDATVADVVDAYQRRAAPLAERPAGQLAKEFDRTASAGGDHPLGHLVADAQLAATRAHGAVVALANPGGMRTNLRPRATDGTVTYADVYAAQPFGNTLITVTLTGSQLKTLLEQQWREANPDRPRILQPSRGFRYAWDARRPVGDRVIADSIRLDGRRIEDQTRYRVTVNDFLAGGGDGFLVLREGTHPTGGPLDVDALAAYLRTESEQAPLQPDRSTRITRRGGRAASVR